MQELDFSDMSPDDIISSVSGNNRKFDDEVNLSSMSMDEIAKIANGYNDTYKGRKKTQGLEMGVGDRVNANIAVETGIDTTDAYGDLGGAAVSMLTSVAPFAKGYMTAGADRMRQALVETADTGDIGKATWEDRRAMQKQLDEWNATEGKRYDIAHDYASGEIGKEDLPVEMFKKVFNPKTGRYNVTNKIDDKYLEPKEDAQKRYVANLATDILKGREELKRTARESMEDDESSDWTKVGSFVANNAGYVSEFVVGAGAMKAVGAAGWAGASAQKIAQGGLAAAKAAGISKKAMIAYQAGSSVIPAVSAAIRRYNALRSSDLDIDENGELYVVSDPENVAWAASKAVGGGALEAGIETFGGIWADKLVGIVGSAVKSGIGASAKSIAAKCPKFVQFFSKTGSKVPASVKDSMVNLLRGYKSLSEYTQLGYLPGEIVEEFEGGIVDDVLGINRKNDIKNEDFIKFTRNFCDWDNSLKEMTLGILATMAIQGGMAGARNAYYNTKYTQYHDRIVRGAAAFSGLTADEIESMSSQQRDAMMANFFGSEDAARLGITQNAREILSSLGVEEQTIKNMSDEDANKAAYALSGIFNIGGNVGDTAQAYIDLLDSQMQDIANKIIARNALNLDAVSVEGRKIWLDMDNNVHDDPHGRGQVRSVKNYNIDIVEQNTPTGSGKSFIIEQRENLKDKDGNPLTFSANSVKDAYIAAKRMARTIEAVKEMRQRKVDLAESMASRMLGNRNLRMYDTMDTYLTNNPHMKGRVDQNETGFTDVNTGDIVMILDNINTPAEILETMFHENGVHNGLRMVFNDAELNNFLKNVRARSVDWVMPGVRNAYGNVPQEKLVEEALAHIYEIREANPTLYQRTSYAIRNVLRGVFGNAVKFNEADVECIMQEAQRLSRVSNNQNGNASQYSQTAQNQSGVPIQPNGSQSANSPIAALPPDFQSQTSPDTQQPPTPPPPAPSNQQPTPAQPPTNTDTAQPPTNTDTAQPPTNTDTAQPTTEQPSAPQGDSQAEPSASEEAAQPGQNDSSENQPPAATPQTQQSAGAQPAEDTSESEDDEDDGSQPSGESYDDDAFAALSDSAKTRLDEIAKQKGKIEKRSRELAKELEAVSTAYEEGSVDHDGAIRDIVDEQRILDVEFEELTNEERDILNNPDSFVDSAQSEDDGVERPGQPIPPTSATPTQEVPQGTADGTTTAGGTPVGTGTKPVKELSDARKKSIDKLKNSAKQRSVYGYVEQLENMNGPTVLGLWLSQGRFLMSPPSESNEGSDAVSGITDARLKSLIFGTKSKRKGFGSNDRLEEVLREYWGDGNNCPYIDIFGFINYDALVNDFLSQHEAYREWRKNGCKPIDGSGGNVRKDIKLEFKDFSDADIDSLERDFNNLMSELDYPGIHTEQEYNDEFLKFIRSKVEESQVEEIENALKLEAEEEYYRIVESAMVVDYRGNVVTFEDFEKTIGEDGIGELWVDETNYKVVRIGDGLAILESNFFDEEDAVYMMRKDGWKVIGKSKVYGEAQKMFDGYVELSRREQKKGNSNDTNEEKTGSDAGNSRPANPGGILGKFIRSGEGASNPEGGAVQGGQSSGGIGGTVRKGGNQKSKIGRGTKVFVKTETINRSGMFLKDNGDGTCVVRFIDKVNAFQQSVKDEVVPLDGVQGYDVKRNGYSPAEQRKDLAEMNKDIAIAQQEEKRKKSLFPNATPPVAPDNTTSSQMPDGYYTVRLEELGGKTMAEFDAATDAKIAEREAKETLERKEFVKKFLESLKTKTERQHEDDARKDFEAQSGVKTEQEGEGSTQADMSSNGTPSKSNIPFMGSKKADTHQPQKGEGGFTLESLTKEEAAAEKKRLEEQERKRKEKEEIERRQAEKLKGGGEFGQGLLGLGVDVGEDLFNRIIPSGPIKDIPSPKQETPESYKAAVIKELSAVPNVDVKTLGDGTISVTGNGTFDIKDALKKRGFMWAKKAKAWQLTPRSVGWRVDAINNNGEKVEKIEAPKQEEQPHELTPEELKQKEEQEYKEALEDLDNMDFGNIFARKKLYTEEGVSEKIKAMQLGTTISRKFFGDGGLSFEDFFKFATGRWGTNVVPFLQSWYLNGALTLDSKKYAKTDSRAKIIKFLESKGYKQNVKKVVEGERPGAITVLDAYIPTPEQHAKVEDFSKFSGFTLDAEQLRGVNLMLDKIFNTENGSFLLADGTGFGKTAQLLAVIKKYHDKFPNKRILLVTQNKNIINDRFAKDAIAMGIHPSIYDAKTYHDMAKVTEDNYDYSLALFDEAHNFRNADAKKSIGGAKIRAPHKIYATATPMDKPIGAIYFLSEITGKTQEQIMDALGIVIKTYTDKRTGEQRDAYVPRQDMNWPRIWQNIQSFRDAAIISGSMIRREYPFYGKIKTTNVPVEEEYGRALSELENLLDSRIAEAVEAGQNPMFLSGQKTITLGRATEPLKVKPTFNLIKEYLNRGNQVIVVAETANEQGFDIPFPKAKKRIVHKKGRFGPYTEEKYFIKGALQSLSELLDAEGIKHGKIYGNNIVGRSAAAQQFQSGMLKVVLMTPESGGTGIDLDDQVGDSPRVMLMMSQNYSANTFDQIAGRSSRKNTKSPSLMIGILTDTFSDHRRNDILAMKLRTLRAIQGGADSDVARGFNRGTADEVVVGEDVENETNNNNTDGIRARKKIGRAFMQDLNSDHKLYSGNYVHGNNPGAAPITPDEQAHINAGRPAKPKKPNAFKQALGSTPQQWVSNIANADNFKQMASPILRRIADYRLPILKMEQALGISDKAKSAYFESFRSHGHDEYQIRQFINDYVKPISKALVDNNIDLDKFNEFLLAMAGPSRNDMIFERTKEVDLKTGEWFGEENGSGHTTEYWNTIVNEAIQNGTYDKMYDVAQKVWEMNHAVLDRYVDNGRMSKRQADVWKAKSLFYVPMRTLVTEEYGDLLMNDGAGSMYGKTEFKHALGRSTEAEAPLEFSFLQAAESFHKCNDNNVRKKLANIVRQHSNIGKVFTVASAPSTVRYSPQTGKEYSAVDLSFLSNDNVVSFKENGELKYIELYNNPEEKLNGMQVGRAIKRTSLNNFGSAQRALYTMARGFAVLRTTASPEFVASNFMSDSRQAIGNIASTFGWNAAKDFTKNVIPSIMSARRFLNFNLDMNNSHDRYVREWAEGGAMIGGYTISGVRDLQEKLEHEIKKNVAKLGKTFLSRHNPKNSLQAMMDLAESMNGVFELCTRINTYETARKHGMSIEDAVDYSRNVTVDFNKKGEWSPMLNSLYIFSNASIQGTMRYGQRLGEKNGLKVTAVFAAIGFLSTILNNLLDDDDDAKEGKPQYNDLSDYKKQNYINIRVSDGLITLPVRGIDRLETYFGVLAADVIMGKESPVAASKKYAAFMADNMLDPIGSAPNMIQRFTPSIVRPAVELGQNESFSGSQISRVSPDPYTPKSTLGRTSTHPMWHGIAKGVNKLTGGNDSLKGGIDMSPETYRHILQWAGGSFGNDIARSVGFVSDVAHGELPDVRNIPFVRRAASPLGENSAKFHDAINKFREVKRQKKNIDDLTDSEVKTLVSDNPYLTNDKWFKIIDSTDNVITRLQRLESKTEDLNVKKELKALRMKAQYNFIKMTESNPYSDEFAGGNDVRDIARHNKILDMVINKGNRELKRNDRKSPSLKDRLYLINSHD